jgi:acetoin:2,6-dichlorophenolindophenol oxidoreductase subunit alpha
MTLHTLLALYRAMARIRAFEDAAEAASVGGVGAFGAAVSASAKVRGPLHLSTGQEAVPVGVCAHLLPTDLLTSTHRGHGHTLAKGADVNRMMAELFGKSGGSNGGKGGSMHIADFSVGMLGANGVVAAGLPIACGAAHALKLRHDSAAAPSAPRDLVACFFGDGAINRGPFLEALNWAVVYQLPVLFVCEDNRFSATTATAPMTAGPGAAARAAALGLPTAQADGNDVQAVHAAAGRLIDAVRAGAGPQLLHALTWRVKGHVSVDVQGYRSAADLAAARERDPLLVTHAQALQLGATAQQLAALGASAQAEIAAALQFAESSAPPQASAAYTDVQTLGAGVWY